MFVRPKFFRKRVAFFNVISLIWISADHIGYIYDIYGLILTASKEHPSFDTLLRYFHDLTGIIEPIENYKSFKIVVELAL